MNNQQPLKANVDQLTPIKIAEIKNNLSMVGINSIEQVKFEKNTLIAFPKSSKQYMQATNILRAQ